MDSNNTLYIPSSASGVWAHPQRCVRTIHTLIEDVEASELSVASLREQLKDALRRAEEAEAALAEERAGNIELLQDLAAAQSKEADARRAEQASRQELEQERKKHKATLSEIAALEAEGDRLREVLHTARTVATDTGIELSCLKSEKALLENALKTLTEATRSHSVSPTPQSPAPQSPSAKEASKSPDDDWLESLPLQFT